jgi:Beta protein
MSRNTLYVPILRSRAAERNAVRQLSSRVREVTAPLFEIATTTQAAWINLSPRQVARAVTNLVYGSSGSGELYIDLKGLLDRKDAAAICTELQTFLVSLHSDARLVFSLADLNRSAVTPARTLIEANGAAFRVTPRDHPDVALSNVPKLLRRLGVATDNVDLIVDCQLVEEHQPLKGTAAKLEKDYWWRSITYVGGSFPPNLTNLRKNDQHELPRHEWITFESEHSTLRAGVRFGDYTVQHPFQPDDISYLPSGSIRYASDQHWVVMRGEKLDNPKGPGWKQYIGQAQLLCDRSEFQACGPEFSAGDTYIHFMANQTKTTGSPETWLRAAINHHITLVAHQLERAAA